jgi:hypothetical protein
MPDDDRVLMITAYANGKVDIAYPPSLTSHQWGEAYEAVRIATQRFDVEMRTRETN